MSAAERRKFLGFVPGVQTGILRGIRMRRHARSRLSRLQPRESAWILPRIAANCFVTSGPHVPGGGAAAPEDPPPDGDAGLRIWTAPSVSDGRQQQLCHDPENWRFKDRLPLADDGAVAAARRSRPNAKLPRQLADRIRLADDDLGQAPATGVGEVKRDGHSDARSRCDRHVGYIARIPADRDQAVD